MRQSLLLALAALGASCGDDSSGHPADLARFDAAAADRAAPVDQAVPADQAVADQSAPDDGPIPPPPDGPPPPPPDDGGPPPPPDDGGPPSIDGGGCLTSTDCPNANDLCQFFVQPGCNGPGACVQKPQLCPQIVLPVCGCDNMTYQNSCYAAKAGVNVKSKGMCP
jgi:hypothetical protein